MGLHGADLGRVRAAVARAVRDSSAETTTFTPAAFQARTSSSSQSPPRGRGMMAKRPGHGPSIQYNSVRMSSLRLRRFWAVVLGDDLSREAVNVDAAVPQDLDAVVSVNHRTIRPGLE